MDTKNTTRYCYWVDGMEKPAVFVPPNCEYQVSPEKDDWRKELCSLAAWSGDHKRRWPSRMDAFDDLFIRACKKWNLNTVYSFKRIMAKRCGLETKYIGMYNVTIHLWDIIKKYNLVSDMNKVVEEFMRPLYYNNNGHWNGLCSPNGYPDFGAGKENILASFVIAKNIIRNAEASKFEDLSTPAWFRNKGIIKREK